MERDKLLLLGHKCTAIDTLNKSLGENYDVLFGELGHIETEDIINQNRPTLIIIYAKEMEKWQLYPIKECKAGLLDRKTSILAIAPSEVLNVINTYLDGLPITSVRYMDKLFAIVKAVNDEVKRINEELQSDSYIQKKKILMIEDDKESIRQAYRVLSFSFDITFVNTHTSTISATKKDDFDLIIYNLSCLEIPGKTFFQYLKSSESTAYTPVICVETAQNKQKLTECIELKPSGFLIKPYADKALKDEVLKAVSD